ncbi:MAG: electron transport complex subunit RsxC [Candidatus Eisenbacteria sp.]|nr:electron transport complex subunit RsxC [Candidatus Eisenbacteria bacterium]
MAVVKPIPDRLEKRRLTFKGGVHPPEHKEITEHKPIERAPLPPEIFLPTAMHVGAPATPVVAKKDVVSRAQLVAEASGFVSAPIHSPVSGTVKDVLPLPHQSGRMVLSIVIQTDVEKTEEIIRAEASQGVEANIDLSPYTPEQIVRAVKDAGIVGLGGAAFPTFIKLTPNEQKPTDIVILNGTECEPFLTADHRSMLETPGRIIAGLRLAMKATGAPRGAIGIEDNKPDAIASMKKALQEANVTDRIEICTLRTKYPQGGERNLIPAITGRAVPVGGFPPDVGIAIFNVGTAAAIALAVAHSRPLMERVMTLTGLGIKNPGNLLVQIGTPLQFLVDKCGGTTHGASMAILGGPMMGPTAPELNLPVLKGMSGITVLTHSETRPRKEFACIRCGRCVDACPLGLMPSLLARLGQRRRAEEALRLNVLACVECGSCSYVCPSNIPLVQYIRSGKAQAQKIARKK